MYRLGIYSESPVALLVAVFFVEVLHKGLKIPVSVVRFRLEAPFYSSLVQSVERWTVNPYVAGSSPAGGANSMLVML